MIPRRIVLALGLSQFVCWGVSYYVIGVFAGAMADGLGWRVSTVHGGFTLALVVMGLVSPTIGRLVDAQGGRRVMAAGSVLTAASLGGLALADGVAGHYAAWALLGVAMRLSLYDAAFAALVRIGGGEARRAISHVTLLGGLASSAFWPIGQALIEALGWRDALWAFAACALATLPLHLMLPAGKAPRSPSANGQATPGPVRRVRGAAPLYVAITMLSAFTNAGISAHMIGILAGLGVAMAGAVWIASLRGVGQSAARLAEVIGGRRLDPLALGALATGLQPASFLLGLFSAGSVAAGMGFALLYGAGHGLMTIARGTMPLVLFDPAHYGAQVGRLLAPSFFVAALGPLAYALVIDMAGPVAALILSAVLGLVSFGAAAVLHHRGKA